MHDQTAGEEANSRPLASELATSYDEAEVKGNIRHSPHTAFPIATLE